VGLNRLSWLATSCISPRTLGELTDLQSLVFFRQCECPREWPRYWPNILTRTFYSFFFMSDVLLTRTPLWGQYFSKCLKIKIHGPWPGGHPRSGLRTFFGKIDVSLTRTNSGNSQDWSRASFFLERRNRSKSSYGETNRGQRTVAV